MQLTLHFKEFSRVSDMQSIDITIGETIINIRMDPRRTSKSNGQRKGVQIIVLFQDLE